MKIDKKFLKKYYSVLKNQDYKSYLSLVLFLFLFVSVLILGVIDFSNIKIGQAVQCDTCREMEYVDTEYISQDMTCSKCSCSQAGKKIFSFYGTEADCENMEKEEDRSDCYAKHSLKEQTCGHIADNNLKRECLDRFTSMTYKYYLGPGGTLVNQNNVTIKGDTTVLNGFDQHGEHKLMTGVDEGSDLFITFRRKSGDVEFNNDLFVPGDLRINSTYGGVYFGSELVFDNMVYENGDLSSWRNPPKFAQAEEQPFSSPTTHDDDWDGINNRDDNCRSIPNPGQQNDDGDGMGNACDPIFNPPGSGSPPSLPDSDGDTIPNISDNCPNVSNISQLDTDGDGIGDVCDATIAPLLEDADGDGVYVSNGDCNDSDPTIYSGAYDIPGDGIDQDCDGSDAIITPPLDPLDTDGDTIPNINDNCPNDYNPSQADSDGDGIGDACDSSDPVCEDEDGDGYFSHIGCGSAFDCDDNDNRVHPGSTERSCEQIDWDCSGSFEQINGAWQVINIPAGFDTTNAICKDVVDQTAQIECTDNPQAYRGYWSTSFDPYIIGSCKSIYLPTGQGGTFLYNEAPSGSIDYVLIDNYNPCPSCTTATNYVRDVWYR